MESTQKRRKYYLQKKQIYIYLTEGKKTRGNSDRQGMYTTRSEQNQEVRGVNGG